MSSSPSLLDPPRSRPMHHMPSRLLSSLKRPFSRSKPEPNSSILPDRTREPSPGATPPSYEQIAMGLHLSRTPHFPPHLAHLYPPSSQPRLQRCVSSPASSTPHCAHKGRPNPAHLYPSYPSPSRSRSHTPSTTPSPSRSYTRLPPPPARSALKKPHVKATGTSSSGLTPDTASASTVPSSITPPTPTNSSARSGLLSRFLGKERGTTPPLLVAIIAEAEPSGSERKAVRFGGVEEEDG